LGLELRRMGSILIIKVCGEFDLGEADNCRRQIDERVRAEGVKELLFDLEKVTFIDSSGLGVILGRYRKAKENEGFREMLSKGGPMVIIGDNSGEIYFDYMLMANLRSFVEEIFYVVKGGPILNDATMEDVEGTGISNLAKIITTGSNYLGVIPEKCSEELCSVMESASIVLAKGQANYETLEGTSLAGDKTFFLLQAKCSVIAEHLGVEPGDSVLVRNI
jgi:anti-anti-sigma factor